MSSHRFISSNGFERGVSRRTFVKGLAVGGTVAGLGLWRPTAWAQGATPVASTTLSGTEFDLRIGETPMNFTGRPRVALTVNGAVPAPTNHSRRSPHGTNRRVASVVDAFGRPR